MDGAVNGEAKPSQLAGYFGDDPLAIAMAQSGIQSCDQWALMELDADSGEECHKTAPAGDLQPEDDDGDDDAGGAGGGLDSWLSSYYYTVDEDDPDDPSARHSDGTVQHMPDPGSPVSVLPRLVASLGWSSGPQRPPYTYEELAALAICSSAGRRLSAPHIAAFVRSVYPFFRQHEPQLQTCVEQALYAGACFRRLPGSGAAPSRCWTVTAEGERRLAETLRRRGAAADAGPARPAWQEDHSYAAEEPAAKRRRVKLATKT